MNGKLSRWLYITIIVIVCILTAILILTTACAQNIDTQYLRIHIRANSNSQADQDVKLQVKNAVTEYLTPLIEDDKTIDCAMHTISSQLPALQELAEEVLEENGFYYGASVRLCQEQFPARTYGSLTLPDGIYDALIIELGSGEGDNWWCVLFPPLCFVSAPSGDFAYKSIIAELWEKYVAN